MYDRNNYTTNSHIIRYKWLRRLRKHKCCLCPKCMLPNSYNNLFIDNIRANLKNITL